MMLDESLMPVLEDGTVRLILISWRCPKLQDSIEEMNLEDRTALGRLPLQSHKQIAIHILLGVFEVTFPERSHLPGLKFPVRTGCVFVISEDWAFESEPSLLPVPPCQ